MTYCATLQSYIGNSFLLNWLTTTTSLATVNVTGGIPRNNGPSTTQPLPCHPAQEQALQHNTRNNSKPHYTKHTSHASTATTHRQPY